MKKKELEQKIIWLNERIENLYKKLSDAENTIETLCFFQNGEVMLIGNSVYWLRGGKVNRATKENVFKFSDIIENHLDRAVIKGTTKYGVDIGYYKLDKWSGNIMDITDIYHEKVEGETQATSEPTEEKRDCKCKKGGKK